MLKASKSYSQMILQQDVLFVNDSKEIGLKRLLKLKFEGFNY